MSEEKSLEVVSCSGMVEKKVVFEKKDFIAVAIVEVEKTLRNQISQLISEIKSIEKEVKELNKEAEDLSLTCPEFKDVDKEIKLIEKSLRKVSGSSDIKITKSIQVNTGNKKNHLTILYSSPTVRSTYLAIREVNFSDEQVECFNKINNFLEQKKSLEEKAIASRKRLSDIPSLERQIVARVMKSEMEKTEEGQKLLEVMLNDFTSFIEGLV